MDSRKTSNLTDEELLSMLNDSDFEIGDLDEDVDYSPVPSDGEDSSNTEEVGLIANAPEVNNAIGLDHNYFAGTEDLPRNNISNSVPVSSQANDSLDVNELINSLPNNQHLEASSSSTENNPPIPENQPGEEGRGDGRGQTRGRARGRGLARERGRGSVRGQRRGRGAVQQRGGQPERRWDANQLTNNFPQFIPPNDTRESRENWNPLQYFTE